jgi:hypothetical protein
LAYILHHPKREAAAKNWKELTTIAALKAAKAQSKTHTIKMGTKTGSILAKSDSLLSLTPQHDASP